MPSSSASPPSSPLDTPPATTSRSGRTRKPVRHYGAMVDSDAIPVSDGEDERWQRGDDDDDDDGSYGKKRTSGDDNDEEDDAEDDESMGEVDEEDEDDQKLKKSKAKKPAATSTEKKNKGVKKEKMAKKANVPSSRSKKGAKSAPVKTNVSKPAAKIQIGKKKNSVVTMKTSRAKEDKLAERDGEEEADANERQGNEDEDQTKIAKTTVTPPGKPAKHLAKPATRPALLKPALPAKVKAKGIVLPAAQKKTPSSNTSITSKNTANKIEIKGSGPSSKAMKSKLADSTGSPAPVEAISKKSKVAPEDEAEPTVDAEHVKAGSTAKSGKAPSQNEISEDDSSESEKPAVRQTYGKAKQTQTTAKKPSNVDVKTARGLLKAAQKLRGSSSDSEEEATPTKTVPKKKVGKVRSKSDSDNERATSGVDNDAVSQLHATREANEPAEDHGDDKDNMDVKDSPEGRGQLQSSSQRSSAPRPTPTKRKREAQSDGSQSQTPKKKPAPADKVTNNYRVAIIAAMTTTSYIKHVDFKGVFGADYAKMSRHWREVLSEDIRSSIKGTSGKPPGKITAAERQKIWKAVCAPYDKLNWDKIIEDVWDGDEENGECTMTVTKLKRHFRDVMKREGEKVAGAR